MRWQELGLPLAGLVAGLAALRFALPAQNAGMTIVGTLLAFLGLIGLLGPLSRRVSRTG